MKKSILGLTVNYVPSLVSAESTHYEHMIINAYLKRETHQALFLSEHYAYDICYNCKYFKNMICKNKDGDLNKESEYDFIVADECDCPGFEQVNKFIYENGDYYRNEKQPVTLKKTSEKLYS